MVKTTGMGEGVLYRSASPIDPAHGRNAFADAAARAAGVTVVLNLADDEETARGYEGFEESWYAGTAFLTLNMGIDFAAAESGEKLARGIRFLAAHPGVVLIHCTEGKDRAGFAAALLECLMGASWEEAAEDYMTSFTNYYGVTPDDARYDIILRNGLGKTLSRVFGIDDPASADLAACAEAYLLDCGVTAEVLAALKRNLSGASAPAGTAAEPVPEAGPEAEPEAAPAGDAVYIVVRGDCLWRLARRFYGDPLQWRRIASANALADPDLIYPGQALRIPA